MACCGDGVCCAVVCGCGVCCVEVGVVWCGDAVVFVCVVWWCMRCVWWCVGMVCCVCEVNVPSQAPQGHRRASSNRS